MTVAFIFPGQGSQSVGMGREFYDSFQTAREVFEEVDEALGQKLSKIILEGSEQDLTLTENTQPALMATSLAVVRTLEKESGKKVADFASFMAGHSLGEYSALCAANVFSLSDTAKLLRTRGSSMQEAVPVGEGAMAAILGLDLETCEALAHEALSSSGEGSVCVVANDNCPGQAVLSGHKQAIDEVIKLAPEKGARRALPLSVSAPFHCPLMAPAAEKMQQALAGVSAQTPTVKIVANVTADVVETPEEIKNLLVQQVTGKVRWSETGQRLKDLGVTQTVELGAGKVLSGLIKRIAPEITTTVINTPADMEAFLKDS